ncbi:MAG: trigger factor [Candidatus Pacebacteria bacterium]|nr:trigger factor [Candidatus Paceibacterota bacterium]
MEIKVKDVSNTKKKIEIEINAEEFNVFYDKAFKLMTKELEMPGFRKGMVPESMAKEKINENNVLNYAAELIINEKWSEYLKETDLEIVSQPVIDVIKVAKDNPFVFSAEVETLKDIDLPDFKAIAKTIKKQEVKVEEKEINDAITWLQQSRAIFKDKEGAVETGDFVEITLFENEKEQKDGFIVGKGHELDTVLINMNPGEEKEAKPGLKIILNSVKKVEIPEINDEFVKTLGQFNTIEELKKNIEQGLKQEKETAIKQKQRAEVLEKIATKIKIDIPQSLVEREAQGLISNLQNRVKNELNISFEEYLDQTKKTLEQVQKEFEKIAYDRVRNFLIIRQIIKNQGIEVKKEEIEDRIKEILANYPEESKKQIDLDRIKLYIEDEIKNEKAFALLNL